MSQPIRGRGGHIVFPIGPNNTSMVDDVGFFLPVKFRQIPFSGFREEMKMSQLIRRRGGHLFPTDLQNTNLVKDVQFLLPVKFRQIPFSGFREEVENDSANQRSGGHLVFPIGPKTQTG